MATLTISNTVSRSSIDANLIGASQLFESRDATLCRLSCDGVAIARYQEAESRSKKLVAVERLDDELFCMLQLSSKYIDSKHNEIISDNLPSLPDFDKEDWWHSYKDDSKDEASLVQLDFGHVVEVNASEEALPETILEDVRLVYLDTLYNSKAPLVYLAKSTFPKLRSRVGSGSISMQDYLDFLYRHLVPSLDSMDLKYKEFLPTYVKAELTGLPLVQDPSCLGQDEESHIGIWLENCTKEVERATPDNVLRMIAPLRSREYYIIILVLLECLLGSYNSTAEDKLSPDLLIDVLIDRLAIAQSLDFTSSEDPLKAFCVEILNPFYSSRLPDLAQRITAKCVVQNLIDFELPPTPASRRKVQTQSKSAKLKRTRSAPANLLSEKRIVPKKRALGREVSMTRRAPSFEIKPVVPTLKKAATFEEQRKSKYEALNKQSIQVGQTPVKPQAAVNLDEYRDTKDIFRTNKNSKANFMTIGETPVKNSISPSPVKAASVVPVTPIGLGRVFLAPAAGVQDTPSGRGIRFKLDSPKRRQSTKQTDVNVFADSRVKRTGSGLFSHLMKEKSPDLLADSEPPEKKEIKLDEVLDWL